MLLSLRQNRSLTQAGVTPTTAKKERQMRGVKGENDWKRRTFVCASSTDQFSGRFNEQYNPNISRWKLAQLLVFVRETCNIAFKSQELNWQIDLRTKLFASCCLAYFFMSFCELFLIQHLIQNYGRRFLLHEGEIHIKEKIIK